MILGLNYRNESDEFMRHPEPGRSHGYRYTRTPLRASKGFHLDQMVNYVTPGYATAVFVSNRGIQCIRSTAESHRRVAIIEVMGRHSGYIALGAAFGQPDILLVPGHPINVDLVVHRVKQIYELQKHVVIVCAEGIVDEKGRELGAAHLLDRPGRQCGVKRRIGSAATDIDRAAEDDYFTSKRRNESAKAAIFTRKVGHTQRGGPPILFDRFYATQLGGQAVDMLLEGQMNAVAILNWTEDLGFYLDSIPANYFRDRYGLIHARKMHPSFYDPELMKPSHLGNEYLRPIFTNCIGPEDLVSMRQSLFDPGNLTRSYQSVNTEIHKRIRYLDGAE